MLTFSTLGVFSCRTILIQTSPTTSRNANSNSLSAAPRDQPGGESRGQVETSRSTATVSTMTTTTAVTSPSFMQRIDCQIMRPENGEFGFVIAGGYPGNARIHSIHPFSAVKDIFQVEDVVLSINNQDISKLNHPEIIELVMSLPKGVELPVTLLREKRRPAGSLERTLTLALNSPLLLHSLR